MQHVYLKIDKEINQRIQEQHSAIAKGNCETLRDYGKACGYSQGLETALGIVKEHWNAYISKIDEFGDDNGTA